MTTKADVLRAIRANCVECCGGSMPEVSKCTVQACDLYPFRFGKDPNPNRGRGFSKATATRTPDGKDRVPAAPAAQVAT